MRKLLTILLIFVLISVGNGYILYQFHVIEREAAPFITKKAQLDILFTATYPIFTRVANGTENLKNGYYIFNSSKNGAENAAQFGEIAVIDDIIFLMETLKFYRITKSDNTLSIYQVNPYKGSDVSIGVWYQYDTKQWRYFYSHNVSCEHKHKYIYKLYDLIFNSKADEVLHYDWLNDWL